MSNPHLTDPNIRKMLAEEILAIRKMRKVGMSEETIYWAISAVNSVYHRIQLRIDRGDLAWRKP